MDKLILTSLVTFSFLVGSAKAVAQDNFLPDSQSVKKVVIRINKVKSDHMVRPKFFFLPGQKPIKEYAIQDVKVVNALSFSLQMSKGKFGYGVSPASKGGFGDADDQYESEIFGVIEFHTEDRVFDILITKQGLNRSKFQKQSNLLYSWLIAKTINDALKSDGPGLTQAGFNRLAGMEMAVGEQFSFLNPYTDEAYEKYAFRPANVWNVFDGIVSTSKEKLPCGE